jgi:hypothetical protein
MVAILGHSLVKPSLYLRLNANTISAKPAENNRIQAKKYSFNIQNITGYSTIELSEIGL